MILQYFKKKENEYKKIADSIYINILNKSKKIIRGNYFEEINFDTSFEIITIILFFYLKNFKEKNALKYKKINDELMKNLINDLDKSIREIGIGDMSIGKYVKIYVKKFYFRIKKVDYIFNNFNEENFKEYLNSLKSINVKYTSKLIKELMKIYKEIIANNQLI